MKEPEIPIGILQTLYNQTDFYQWQLAKKFIKITEENVHKYYLIYQKDMLCQNRRCQECSGMLSTYIDEDAIIQGNVVPVRCLWFEGEKRKSSCIVKSTQLLKSLAIPFRYRDTTWSSLDRVSPQIKEEIQGYIERFPNNDPQGLYIHSTANESGKTSCLWLLIQGLLAQSKLSREYVFMKIGDLLTELRKDNLDADNSVLKKVLKCSILIIDDFGREVSTEFAEKKIYSILDYRLDNNLPYVLASHLPLNESVWLKDIERTILSRINAGCQLLEIIPQQPVG